MALPIHEELESLLGNVDSRYKLAIIAAKRARLLNMGAERRADVKSNKLTTIALYETLLGKVTHREPDEPTPKRRSRRKS